jgi:virginiamycin B lyase
MATDDRDRLWLAETGPRPNRLVAFDPATQTWTDSAPIPSGAGSVRHMVFHAPTTTLWFGTDANTIGRARLDD